ncbi:MAG: polysaccharide deacetylase family protein [Flavobacteriaceae bacterium]|nr:polysaccharide deacetylase family protein [Flavobacteriaceae bacterium]
MKCAKIKTINPFYHFVVDGRNELTNYLYTPKTKAQFNKDLQFLKKYFHSLTAKDIANSNHNLDSFGFFLSFDDGLSNFYSVVAPMLLKEKVHAVNFLNSDFIDNQDLFYRYKVNLLITHIRENVFLEAQKNEIAKIIALNKITKSKLINTLKTLSSKDSDKLDKLAKLFKISFKEFLKKKTPYLTTEQILELKMQGFYFGAHSKNHPYYAEISLEEQIKQTIESVTVVENKFNLAMRLFSFPFSDDGVGDAFFDTMKKEKIITFGTAGIRNSDNPLRFQRIPMEYNTVYSAETIIKGELIYHILKKIIGKQ